MNAMGRLSGRACSTIVRVTRTPDAPAQAITRSASASAAGRSARVAGVAAYSVASRWARSGVRLATVTDAAPSRDTVAVARPAMVPAPTTRTRCPATALMEDLVRAAPTSVGATRSMSVSARERLPTRSACWKSTLRAGPTVPSS